MAEWKNGCVDVSAQDASFEPSRIEVLKAHLGALLDAGRIQAAGFLLARDGKIFAHAAAGRLTYRKDSPPFTVDSVTNIASITKIITATAVMKLVEDGKLWIDQPIAAVIKEFDTPMHGRITIRHLLTHTSGLTADDGYFSEPYPISRWEQMRGPDWLTKGVLAGPVQCQPGEQWNYCSMGFAVLGELVTRLSGMHFNEYVEKMIFAPLGMTRSFLEVPKKLLPETVIKMDWENMALEHCADRTGAPNAGGGVYSTLKDMFTFGQMALNGGSANGGRVLGKKTIQEMTRNQLTGVPAYHWGKRIKDYRQGLGWAFFADGSTTGPAAFNHDGWGWHQVFVDPVERFVMVIFTPDPTEWKPEVVVEPRAIAFSGLL